MTNNQDSELQGAEREREALAHIRKEQALRTGAIFDELLLKYLDDGDSPEFRQSLKLVTIDYLRNVINHPHVIKAVVPDWVVRLLVAPSGAVPFTFHWRENCPTADPGLNIERLVEKGDITIDATADSNDESEDAE